MLFHPDPPLDKILYILLDLVLLLYVQVHTRIYTMPHQVARAITEFHFYLFRAINETRKMYTRCCVLAGCARVYATHHNPLLDQPVAILFASYFQTVHGCFERGLSTRIPYPDTLF